MIKIEIKGHSGQFIKGFLRRIVEDKGAIVYADDPSTEEPTPLSELRLPPTEDSDQIFVVHFPCLDSSITVVNALSLNAHLTVEDLLSVTAQENPQENSFTKALTYPQIFQSIQQPVVSSRLSNPMACLNCPSWWPRAVTKVVLDVHVVVQLRPVLPVVDESAPPPAPPKEFTDLSARSSAMTEICERKMPRPGSGNGKDGGCAIGGQDGSSWNVGDDGHFSMASLLMGLAIGTQRANICNARSVGGFLQTDVHESKRQHNDISSSVDAYSKMGILYFLSIFEYPHANFIVVAQTAEAEKAARLI
ncbi:hypothetical protein Aperf_G00000117219 [Anoplocephala perfoliata]